MPKPGTAHGTTARKSAVKNGGKNGAGKTSAPAKPRTAAKASTRPAASRRGSSRPGAGRTSPPASRRAPEMIMPPPAQPVTRDQEYNGLLGGLIR